MENRPTFVAEIRDARIDASGNGEDRIFTGTAVVFNSPSEPLWTPLGSFREQILPGAIDERLLRNSVVELLYNHDPDSVMATTEAGTLELSIEDDGLRVWARLDPTDPDVQRLEAKVRHRSVNKMSFAFAMDENAGAEERWYEDDDGGIWRDIIRMSELFDVSAVARPAYRQTSANLRTLEAAAAAGKIALPEIAARAETDPAGTAEPGDSEPPAPAETDPVEPEESPLAALKARSKAALEREGESYLRLLKEITQ